MRAIVELLKPRNLRVILLAIPVLLGAIYLFGISADRYVSEAIVAVKESGQSGAGLDGLAMLLAPSGGSARQDAAVLQEYLLSMDMLKIADQRLELRKAFSQPRADFFFRLPSDAKQERFLAYFQSRVEVQIDDTSGLLTVRTQAFTPDMALRLNQLLIETGEKFINDVSHRLAREQLAFAATEVAKAQAGLQTAKLTLENFQREHGILDPTAQAMGNTGVTLELQAALSRKETELRGMLGVYDNDSIQIRLLKGDIAALKVQLEAEAGRGLGRNNGKQLNTLTADYQGLLLGLQFAQDAYRLAMTASESARIESTRKLKNLVLIESPTLPEAVEYPRRWYNLLALALGAMLLYGVVRLVVATIEDHLE